MYSASISSHEKGLLAVDLLMWYWILQCWLASGRTRGWGWVRIHVHMYIIFFIFHTHLHLDCIYFQISLKFEQVNHTQWALWAMIPWDTTKYWWGYYPLQTIGLVIITRGLGCICCQERRLDDTSWNSTIQATLPPPLHQGV